MLEFSAISVSSYEATSLVDRLNEAATDGWAVVSIVPTGSSVTAYLSREASGTAAGTSASVAPTPAEPQPAPVTPQPATLTKAAITPEPATAHEPAIETTGSSAVSTAASTGGAPAGWFADPSGRFEMRYWNGSEWTEHVSRAGQQFTDPPVA